MNSAFKNVTQKLIKLDRETEKLDEILKDLRTEIYNVFWDLMEIKTNSGGKKNKSLLRKNPSPHH